MHVKEFVINPINYINDIFSRLQCNAKNRPKIYQLHKIKYYNNSNNSNKNINDVYYDNHCKHIIYIFHNLICIDKETSKFNNNISGINSNIEKFMSKFMGNMIGLH